MTIQVFIFSIDQKTLHIWKWEITFTNSLYAWIFIFVWIEQN